MPIVWRGSEKWKVRVAMRGAESISGRIISGALLRGVSFVINVGVAFFLMPFIIQSLGDKLYGFWTLIATFVGYYGFLDFGLASAVGRYIAGAIGHDNPKEINQILNTSLVIYSGIGILALLFTFIVVVSSSFLITDKEQLGLFRAAVMIMGPAIAITIPIRAFTGILSGYLRYDLLSYINVSKTFLRAILIYFFLNAGYGIVSLAAIISALEVLACSMTFLVSRKLFPLIRFGLSYYSKTLIKSFFSYSVRSFLIEMGDLLRFRIDVFVIARYLGLTMVTHYTIALRLMEYFNQIVSSAFNTTFPLFTRYESRLDYESIKEKYILLTRLAAGVSIFVGGAIIILGDFFLIRWMGNEYIDAYPVLRILVISAMIMLIQEASVAMLYGISRHGYYVVANTIEGVINLIISLILVKKYGMIGVALGTAIPMIAFKLFVEPAYVCKKISINLFSYYFQTVIPAGICLGGTMICLWVLSKPFLGASYPNLMIAGFIFSTIYFLVCFFVYFRERERKYFYDYANGMGLKILKLCQRAN
jgi:O-antigen/teichoic acid export membrane protein